MSAGSNQSTHRAGIRSSPNQPPAAALAVRRMHRDRRIFLMHLPDRRCSGKRNRDAKGENEREKCKTWGHRKTSFWNQKINAIDCSCYR